MLAICQNGIGFLCSVLLCAVGCFCDPFSLALLTNGKCHRLVSYRVRLSLRTNAIADPRFPQESSLLKEAVIIVRVASMSSYKLRGTYAAMLIKVHLDDM